MFYIYIQSKYSLKPDSLYPTMSIERIDSPSKTIINSLREAAKDHPFLAISSDGELLYSYDKEYAESPDDFYGRFDAFERSHSSSKEAPETPASVMDEAEKVLFDTEKKIHQEMIKQSEKIIPQKKATISFEDEVPKKLEPFADTGELDLSPVPKKAIFDPSVPAKKDLEDELTREQEKRRDEGKHAIPSFTISPMIDIDIFITASRDEFENMIAGRVDNFEASFEDYLKQSNEELLNKVNPFIDKLRTFFSNAIDEDKKMQGNINKINEFLQRLAVVEKQVAKNNYGPDVEKLDKTRRKVLETRDDAKIQLDKKRASVRDTILKYQEMFE